MKNDSKADLVQELARTRKHLEEDWQSTTMHLVCRWERHERLLINRSFGFLVCVFRGWEGVPFAELYFFRIRDVFHRIPSEEGFP